MGGEVSVVKFYPKGAAVNADAVLEQAVGQYAEVLILGYDADGELDVRCTLGLKGADLLWLVESFKAKLINGDYAE